jgi:hypothetical protein
MMKEADTIRDIYEACVDMDVENDVKVSGFTTQEERNQMVKDKEVVDRARGDVCACALSLFCAIARTGLVLADTRLGADEKAEGDPQGPAVKLLKHTLKRHMTDTPTKSEDVAVWGLLLLYLRVRTEPDGPAADEKKYGSKRAMKKPPDEAMPTCADQALRGPNRDMFSDLTTQATDFGRNTEPGWSDEVQNIGRAVQYALKPAHQRERRDTYWNTNFKSAKDTRSYSILVPFRRLEM